MNARSPVRKFARTARKPETLLANVTRTTYGTELTGLIQPNIDLAFKYGAIPSRIDAQDLISNVATS